MLLSIITINYSNADGLHATIQSVKTQTYKEFQYIVIDGGSQDGSAAILKEEQDHIKYFVSEKDAGIYNAMNKGILQAKGNYCLFLNSGDILQTPSTLAEVIHELDGTDIIYGNLNQVTSKRTTQIIYPDFVDRFYFYKNALPHPASFIKKELFYKVGMYNETLKISSDWEFFMIAIIKHQCTYRHIPNFIASFDLLGISSQIENRESILQERLKVINTSFPQYAREYEGFFKNSKGFTTKAVNGYYKIYYWIQRLNNNHKYRVR